MDLNMITQLIGGLGFPIFMCIVLTKELKEERNAHKEEVEKLSNVIENNTIAITTLTVKEEQDD